MIAGIMALGPSKPRTEALNPVWIHSLANLCLFADLVHLRIDKYKISPRGVRRIVRQARAIGKGCRTPIAIVPALARWNRWNWREELLRSLDNVGPEIVLTPDCDEFFDARLWEDIRQLEKMPRGHGLMFDYRMITRDGLAVKKYPRRPHMKAFRWEPNLHYAVPGKQGYPGFARIVELQDRSRRSRARSTIGHYSHFTFEDREGRRLR